MGLTGDAWVQVRVSAPTPLMIAQTLAGWGDLVEVVEPPARDETGRRSVTAEPG